MAEPKLQKSGKWRLRVYVCDDRDGREVFKSFTENSSAACKKAYKAWLASGGLQQLKHEKQSTAPTVRECVESYIEKCKNSTRKTYSPATIKGYVMAMRHGMGLLADVRVDQITIDDLQDLIDYRSEKVCAKTIKNELYILKPAMKPYRNDLDFDLLVYPDQEGEEYVIPTDQQMQELLHEYEQDDEMYIATVLAAFKGMRRSEICALTWGDIDVSAMTIQITHALVMGEDLAYHTKATKTDAGRRVLDISPDILTILKRRALINGRLYDPSARIVSLTPAAVSSKHARTKLKLGHTYTFHGLRHYHCSVMLAMGVPMHYVVHDMGHADDTMAKRVYGQMVREKEKAVSEIVNNHADIILSGSAYNWAPPDPTPDSHAERA